MYGIGSDAVKNLRKPPITHSLTLPSIYSFNINRSSSMARHWDQRWTKYGFHYWNSQSNEGERHINHSVKKCDKSNIGVVWRGQEGIPGRPSELYFSEQMQGRVREGLRTHEQRPRPQTQDSVHWPCFCIIRTNISNPIFQPSHCQLPSESQSHRADPGQRHLLVAGATT